MRHRPISEKIAAADVEPGDFLHDSGSTVKVATVDRKGDLVDILYRLNSGEDRRVTFYHTARVFVMRGN